MITAFLVGFLVCAAIDLATVLLFRKQFIAALKVL